MKELRLGFAMGGGVSLGAFSGAALTEAMKLAILRASWDDHGVRRPYDRIVIDVFSGASAGAMSLVLMLRGLAEPAPAADVWKRLRGQFGIELDDLGDAAKEQLIAAQHVQDLQLGAWVNDVDIETLLGRRQGRTRDLRNVPSLLDRSAVDEIAAKYLRFDGSPTFAGRQLLADRVLFACSLANLTPVLYEAHGEFAAASAGLIGLRDALRSYGHREVRIFDLWFREAIPGEPSRWCRYHAADEVEGTIGDLRMSKTWGKIGATAIAAGAFPFAFEPVVLRRKRYEYGPTLWQQIEPHAEGDEIRFTYVDGGTFNNEPIREAFRMASFIDAHDHSVDFDRRIIFVDPRLAPEAVSFCVPVHTEYTLARPGMLGDFDGFNLLARTSLERMTAHSGTVLGAITNEASSNEADKIFATRKRFQLRDEVRALLAPVLHTQPSLDAIGALVDQCGRMLTGSGENALIPPGRLKLADELERVIREEPGELGELRGGAKDFLDSPADAPRLDLWTRALAYVQLDLVMDLEGKRENAQVIAISPALENEDGEWIYEPLPGHELSGFAGFTSRVSREFQVEMARYCAEAFLEECGLTSPAPDGSGRPVPDFDPGRREQFRRDLEAGTGVLGDRVAELISRSHMNPVLRQAAGWWVGRKVASMGRLEDPRRTIELRITVPDGRFELDGGGLADRDRGPVRLGDQFVLITCLEWVVPREGAPHWEGPNVDVEKQTLLIDYDGLGPLPDRRFCEIELPPAERVARLDSLPYPRFDSRLTPEDRKQRVPASRWDATIAPPTSLEDVLL